MNILYDPLFGISFTSLISLIVFGLINTALITYNISANHIVCMRIKSIHPVRIKPVRMKIFSDNEKLVQTEYH